MNELSNDQYVHIGFAIQAKTLMRIDKLAAEYGLSRTACLQRLVEYAVRSHGEPLEVTATNPDGERRKDGVAITIHNEARKLL